MLLLVQDVMNLAIPFSLLATMRFMKTKGLSSPSPSPSSEKEKKGIKGKGEKNETKKAKGGSAEACLFCSDS